MNDVEYQDQAITVADLVNTSPDDFSASKSAVEPGFYGGAAVSEILKRVQRHTLKNGMTLLMVEDHQAPVVTVQFWVKTGSRNERPGITGISHLFEHMMFRGSIKYGPDEHANLVKRHGGVLNAYTSFDHTVYYETISSDQLELVLHLEAERFANLRLNPTVLREEKKVVAEERRMRYDNSVQGASQEQLIINSYRSTPYSWMVIGWMHDIQNYTLADVQEYYRLHYAPNNIVGVIVGDFESSKALRLVRKYWGKIPPQPTPPAPPMIEIEQKGERRIEFKYPSELPMIYASFRMPPFDHPDIVPLNVVARVLSRGQSSRFYQRLVYQDRMALFAEGDILSLIGPGLFIFSLGMTPGYELAQGERAMWEEVERVRAEGISEAELQKAKNQLETEMVGELVTSRGIASELGRYEADGGDYRKATAYLDGIRRVTNKDVIRVAQKYLNPDLRTVVLVIPTKNGTGGEQ